MSDPYIHTVNSQGRPARMSVNNADHVTFSNVDRSWYRFVRLAASQRRGLGGQEYIQQCAQREANGETAIRPTPEETELMLNDMSHSARSIIHTIIELFERYRQAELMEFVDDDDDEEESGIQFSPSQVDGFLQTLAPVEVSRLEADEVECPICMLEYGTQRGNNPGMEQSALGSDHGVPSEEVPEQPVKLACGHIFGEWCMKKWLLEQPGSCPICRVRLQPAIL